MTAQQQEAQRVGALEPMRALALVGWWVVARWRRAATLSSVRAATGATEP